MQYSINTAEEVNLMLEYAREEAKKYNAGEIATEYLVFGILKIKSSDSC